MRCFKSWCLENFPFLEDDIKALDNYQMMCKLYEYIKHIADDVKNVSEAYATLVEDFELLKAYVDQYLKDMDDVKEAIIVINERLDDVINKANNNALRIEQVNINLRDLINENFNTLKLYVDTQDNILNTKIDNIVIGDINIYDPTTGTIEPLQTVINNLYGLNNTDGLTATEFDALDLTATAFDAYEITAYNFDSQGKTILV